MSLKRRLVSAVVIALTAFALGAAWTPSDAVGRRTGCNQTCIGDFPGECVHTWLNHFCHDPIIGFTGCAVVELEC